MGAAKDIRYEQKKKTYCISISLFPVNQRFSKRKMEGNAIQLKSVIGCFKSAPFSRCFDSTPDSVRREVRHENYVVDSAFVFTAANKISKF